MTPEQVAKPGTEHSAQSALFLWAHLNLDKYPCLDSMFAIPNGGKRGDSQKSSQIQGGILKAEGVKSGVSDIFLPFASQGMHGLFIEMKKKDEKAKPNQLTFGKTVQNAGFGFVVCDSWEKARDTLIEYLTPKLF